MKKFYLSLLAASVCAALVAGCDKKETSVSVADVAVSPNDIIIQIGDTYDFTAVVIPSDATDKSVAWSSSNTDVATVSETGTVTAVAAGTVDITARSKDGSDKLGKGTVKVIPVPTMEITSSLDLTKVNQFNYSEMVVDGITPAKSVKITVEATRGISSLKLKLVTSDPLISLALTGMGLSGSFDLVTLPSDQATQLSGIFGDVFPTGSAVNGKVKVTIDLSAMLLAIVGLPGGVDRFDVVIEAADIKSTGNSQLKKEATLQMKFIDDTPVTPES